MAVLSGYGRRIGGQNPMELLGELLETQYWTIARRRGAGAGAVIVRAAPAGGTTSLDRGEAATGV